MHLPLCAGRANWKLIAEIMNAISFAQATAQEQSKSATSSAQRELSEAQSDAVEARTAASRRLTATQVCHPCLDVVLITDLWTFLRSLDLYKKNSKVQPAATYVFSASSRSHQFQHCSQFTVHESMFMSPIVPVQMKVTKAEVQGRPRERSVASH